MKCGECHHEMAVHIDGICYNVGCQCGRTIIEPAPKAKRQLKLNFNIPLKGDVCSNCSTVMDIVCNTCRRCLGCGHRGECDGDFVNVD